jgi:hypothetical protein
MRASTRQDWLAAAAVLAALAAVFVIPAATTGTSMARAVAAMAIGALVALAVARAPFTFALRVRSGIVLLVALSLWYVLTRLWAVDPGGSMYVGSRLCAFVLLAWAVHTCVLGTAPRRALLGGIAAVALYVSAGPLWDAITEGAPDERLHGLLGYWNATAIVAVILVPTAVALAGTGNRRLIALAGILIPIAGVAEATFASRGALVALLFALLVQAALDPDHRGGLPRALVAGAAFALTLLALSIDGVPVVVALASPALVAIGGFGLVRARRVRREQVALTVVEQPDAATTAPGSASPGEVGAHRPRRPWLVRLVGAVLVLCLVSLLAALVLDSGDADAPPVPEGAPAAQDSGDLTRLTSTDDSERLTWYGEALDMWRDRPVIGQGGDAFDTLRVDIPGLYVQHVHSMPIEVLLEAGIVGALLLAVATVLLLRVLRQGRRSTERALAAAICALILTQSLIDWTLSLPQILAVLAIAGPIALASPPADDDLPAREQAQVPTWAAITMLATLALATTLALTPMLATLLADQAARRIDDGELQEAADLAAQSVQLVPALDTLTLQVISLQGLGEEEAARDALEANEQVWLHRMDGLALAAPLFEGDAERSAEIARRTEQLQSQQADRAAGD